MSLPIIFVGGTQKTRSEKAIYQARKYSNQFDTYTLECQKNNKIDDLRRFLPNIYKRPYNSSFQSFLILEAQNLSIESQNTLLKTLEEPPTATKLFLTAPSKESLLSTIVSRADVEELPLVDQNQDFVRLSKFFSKNPVERYKNMDQLDIDELILDAREKLLGSFENISSSEGKTDIEKWLNYLKILLKAKKLLRNNVSSKIAKTFLLLEYPQ